PNFYHISLHVDDETVFASYGKQYGFKVYELNAQDDEWADKIIEQVRQIKNSAPGSGGDVTR
ncbi:MAG: HAD family hydrolase, partial [Lachnospiraceae bacterium]